MSGRSYFACKICCLSNRLFLCAFTCIFYCSSSLILGISMTLVTLYFLITYNLPGFSCFWIFIPFYFTKYRHLSSYRFNFLFNINFPLWFFIFVRFSFRFNLDSTAFAQAYNMVVTSFISSSISQQDSK